MTSLSYELAQVVDDARAHGMQSIDLAALERLLHRHREAERRDLLQPGDMYVVPLE